MSLTFRDAGAADYAAVEALWQQTNAHHVGLHPEVMKRIAPYQDPEMFGEVLKDEQQAMLLAEAAGNIVGVAWIGFRTISGGAAIPMDVVFIRDIVVSEAERGRGFGQALMAEIERRGRAAGVARVELNVWANNRSAIAFYESLGFSVLRHEMIKPL